MQRKNALAKKRNRVVSFRPRSALVPLLVRLDKLPHVRKSWAFNLALEKSLPAILEEIGA